MGKRKATIYFESQLQFNKWLRALTEEEAYSVIAMIEEFREESLLLFLKWIKENKHRYMLSDEKRFVKEFIRSTESGPQNSFANREGVNRSKDFNQANPNKKEKGINS
jgi:hypothetical protein